MTGTGLNREAEFDLCRDAELKLIAIHDEVCEKFPDLPSRWWLHLMRSTTRGTPKSRMLVAIREYMLSRLDEIYCPHLSTPHLASLLGLTNHSSVVLMRQRIRQRKYSQIVVTAKEQSIV